MKPQMNADERGWLSLTSGDVRNDEGPELRWPMTVDIPKIICVHLRSSAVPGSHA